MKQFIGCDSHKKYSVFVAMNEFGQVGEAIHVGHDREQFREFLQELPAGSPIAVEASGHYYWIVDEMEAAGHRPQLTNPLRAKQMMGDRKKTDKVDARALALLLRNGTLPTVWIPPAELRDQRALLRSRMFMVNERTRLKNRIHGAFGRYNVTILAQDLFSVEGRLEAQEQLPRLPTYTRYSVEREMATVDFLEQQVKQIEKQLQGLMSTNVESDLLKTLPCVGPILGMLMALEIGKVERFAGPGHLASYCGLVPRVISSGGRTRMGHICQDVNHYLRWAFVEAGNLVVMHQKRLTGSHVVRLYRKVQRKHCYQKAVVAVGRHLAEAAYWVLKKQQVYREPQRKAVEHDLSSTHG
jgi:Transposase and inactivated derivatives